MAIKKYSVFIVDDHLLFRNGFKLLLNNIANIHVEDEASNGIEFLEQLDANQPDLVFLDISMPLMDGCEAARRALIKYPHLKIIVLSMYGDESYYQTMVNIGVKGFLLKSSDFNEVRTAIDTIIAGDNYYSQELLVNLVQNFQKTKKDSPHPNDELTDRELEILIDICNGLSNNEIADKLSISKRTVEKHRANVLQKTNCKNTANLVHHAIKNRLIKL